MEIHVAQILREPVGSRRSYRVDEYCDGAVPIPVEGDITLIRTDAGILTIADLDSTVAVTCSRCLEPAQIPLRIHVEEEYYPTIDVVTGARLPDPDELTPFVIDEHHILNLCEAARQQLVLAEPMQPLCKEDCAGLCPVCGRDRNVGACTCPESGTDARWVALGDLLGSSDR
jgi:uncharacterized protein